MVLPYYDFSTIINVEEEHDHIHVHSDDPVIGNHVIKLIVKLKIIYVIINLKYE